MSKIGNESSNFRERIVRGDQREPLAMWLPLVAAYILLFASPVFAQPVTSLTQLSPVDRQKEDFYGAIVGPGPRVQAEWLLAPDTVERGGDTRLTLSVSNAANPTELTRPNLAERPEWKELFETIEVAGEESNAKRVEFQYRLKPRNEGTFTLPLPKYRYYVPQLPDGRRFQASSVPELRLTVTKPKPESVATAAIPVEGPEEFFSVPTRFSYSPPEDRSRSWQWALALVMPLSLAGLGIVVYRWWFPDAVRRAVYFRRQETRRAEEKLNGALRSTDPATQVESALRDYLHARWDIPPEAQTPNELAVSLANIVCDPERVVELESILQSCQNSRFSGEAYPVPVEKVKAWLYAMEAGAK